MSKMSKTRATAVASAGIINALFVPPLLCLSDFSPFLPFMGAQRVEMIFVVVLVMLFLSSAQVDGRYKVESSFFSGEDKASIKEGIEKGLVCSSCLEFSRKAEKALSSPKLLQGFGSLSRDVCHVLPSYLGAKCLEVSKAYIHQTRNFLQQLFREKNLCNSTGLCVGRPMLPINDDFIQTRMVPAKLEENKNCVACRNSAKEVLSKLKINKMRVKIMEALVEYCEEEADNEKQCKQAVYKYVPAVLDKLENLKPGDICHMVGFCDEGVSLF